MDGRRILKWILKEFVCEGAGWIHLAQDGVERRPLVKTAFDLGVK
jgi:hypothetical protein